MIDVKALYEVGLHMPYSSMWSDMFYTFATLAEAEQFAEEKRCEGFSTQINWWITKQRGEWVKGQSK